MITDKQAMADALYDWLIGLMPNGEMLNAAVACDYAGQQRFKRALADKLAALEAAEAARDAASSSLREVTASEVEAACIKYHGTTWHEYADYARRIDRERMRAVLDEFAESATGADGFVRVPLEPTEAMIDAAQSNATGGLMTRDARAAVFRAMASAAPSSAEQPGPPLNDAALEAQRQSMTAELNSLPAWFRADDSDAPGAPEADERARFEAWAMRKGRSTARQSEGYYADVFVRENYTGWQARAQSSAAPVSARDGEAVAGARYFSFSGDAGFDIHKSRDEAEAHAQAALDEYRDEAMDDGWPEEVEQLCWGVVLGGARKSYGEPIPEDLLARYDAAPGDRFVSYSLADEAAPPADARDGEDARRYRWLRDGCTPADAMHHLQHSPPDCDIRIDRERLRAHTGNSRHG